MFLGEIPGRSRLEQLGRRRGPDRVFRMADDSVVTKINHFYNGRSHSRSTAPDGSAAPHGPAVPVDGRHADQSRDLLAVQRAQFGQVRQERQRELFTHAGDRTQQIVLLSPYRASAQRLTQPVVQVLELLFQPGDVILDTGTYRGDGPAQPILLRYQHGHHLVATGGHGVQFLGVDVP